MSDLIERQAVIDAIVNTVSEIGLHDNSEVARYGATFRQHEIIDIIEGMPSAQPTLNNQINLCDSCRHTYPDCPAGKDDVLYGNGKGGDNICACGKYEAERRNTGRWVDAGSGMSMWPWKCSVCGGRQSVISGFCPDCGSKMKSKQFNFCDSCKHSEEPWDEPPCDGCCRGHSAYEPKEQVE